MSEMQEVEQVTERLTETYPCDKCKVEFCSRLCYRMTRWAEIAKEKLEEYETAEEDGRIVVLPCKIGTTVFQISYGFIFIEAINRWINTYDIAEKPFRLWMVDEYGKSIFLTRKEAVIIQKSGRKCIKTRSVKKRKRPNAEKNLLRY